MNIKKLKNIKSKYIILITLIVVILLLFVKKNTEDASVTYLVEKTTVSDKLLLAGTIDAKDRVDLGFASSGRVLKNNFQVGENVKKGDVIAEISQNRLYSDLSKAKANYTLTKVDTDNELESAQDDYQKKLEEQTEIVSGLRSQYLSGDPDAYEMGEYVHDVPAPTVTGTYSGDLEGDYFVRVYSSSAPESGFSFRLTGLETGTYNVRTSQPGELGTRGLYIQFTEGKSYKDTKWIISLPNKRSSTYLTRKTAYENSIKTRERIISESKNNLDRISAFQNTENSRSDAQKTQAKAQVNAVYADIGDGRIIAPFDGIIAKNDLEIGEVVNAFTPEIVIFSGQEKELNVNTPEIYINKINIGDEVDISLDAYKDVNLKGIIDFIDFIDTEVDGVPVYKTDITIRDINPIIRSGMNAKASITSDIRENVIAVPAHFITTNNNGDEIVYIENSDKFEDVVERIVETGLHGNSGLVEIVKGLDAGEVIKLNSK